mmetsp:Transcript_100870/g.140109  ORF Transcript_100870/g.140109 Transcript_100870/m.140109 type:complete len:279 (-) Transcript_100870:80-916(-)
MPKKFGDLAKAVSDLFSDDFGTESSVKVTTKSANGISLECKGVSSGKGTSGELVTSLNWVGLDFKETWKTDGTVTSEVSKKGFVDAKASKAVTELVLSPTDGLKKVTVKANVEMGDIHADVKTAGADIPKSLDVGFVYSFLGNWSLGFKASSKDILSSSPSINKTVAGLYESDAKDLSVYTEVGLDSQVMVGKVYHTATPKTKFGASIQNKGGNTTLAAVGSYTLDELTTVKASLDSDKTFNFASVHKVGAATISPSAVFKCDSTAQPGFGLSIKMAN